jgi:murein DD-endopeptidase MepM/ murein hydrolase activator NlpD
MNDMILVLGLYQVLMPSVLIAAHTLVPSASRIAIALRTAALVLLLVYAALAGLWLFPPWWTPYLLMIFLALGTVYRYRRTRPAHRAWIRHAERAFAGAALIAIGLLLFPAITGRAVPDGAINLAMPLGPGRYLVTSGGTTETINAHLFTLTLERARAFRGQSYAVDIIGIDRFGLRAIGISPADPTAYMIYGTPVLAPCTGAVALVTDGVADMPVPRTDRANMTGNSIMLACDGAFVLLAHLAPGSIAVQAGQAGQAVEVGTRIASVGNSGNTKEPHLHIHVQSAMPTDDSFSGDPVWFTIGGRFLVRNEGFVVPD